MGREHHGTNCAYRADPDEPCTCGVTERTEREMHAAWRKRAEEAETALAAMTAERDDQAEALRQAVASCRCRGTGKWETSCTLCGDSTYDHHCNDEIVDCDRAWCIAARKALAAAAVKEAGCG